MELIRCKRQLLWPFNMIEGKWETFVYGQQGIASEASRHFPLLELPVQVICNILSRLPLKDILRCKCACKMFLEVIKDPYFVSLHLATSPISTTNLILQENFVKRGALHFTKFDLDASALPSSRSDDQKSERHYYLGLNASRKITADFTFKVQRGYLVGSCNGLLCMYFNTSPKPFYGIYNPVLCEGMELPTLPVSASLVCTYSGFGYCPRSKKYKVVRFVSPGFLNHSIVKNSGSMVMEIHTLGSPSWRRIKDVPNLKWESFDPHLNGAHHWINNSTKTSELISTFDLEKEKFLFTPQPSHFTQHYVDKITWINTGVLRNCLCVCYIYEDVEFEVWSMREYGVQESWTKEFSINFNFYCSLQVEDLQRPIKFLSNGELLFISTSARLVSFSPSKKTFRELGSVTRWSTVTTHDLGFTSIMKIAGGRKHEVKRIEVVSPKLGSLI